MRFFQDFREKYRCAGTKITLSSRAWAALGHAASRPARAALLLRRGAVLREKGAPGSVKILGSAPGGRRRSVLAGQGAGNLPVLAEAEKALKQARPSFFSVLSN